ncbi:uncharacterized protein MONOS_6271 [Monocercomonoides exilis]|uniref:uncharacterized protein n=1 Tax=Monocercomonoides exilis TaxID=2049356 RepID=UPI00355AC8A2|nr:hypothetical protein MONOS_6271 [Monocercomonoides exilis]|eukprot:MONOS_6271.1-p1 / transcript=MONOS_6271.1 / gene=MONOS_6271 / organism=Monocercomonoides_exilis_PA203 / gene_product=unspecified product / transcript_product=unspecified product / location=Mono_scaffold00195:45273-45515(+) / protein_length=81 / sequence_SO=supercontig / SO=protein_coding / is_pseudo=false
MEDIKSHLWIAVPEAAGVYGLFMPLSLQQLMLSPHSLQTLLGYVAERRAVLDGGVACAYHEVLSTMLLVPPAEQLPSHAA